MFTLQADTLAAVLDQTAPHRFPVGDDDHDHDAHDHDVLVLDSTPGYLHAVACSDRALAVARTEVAGDVWTAPIAYEDAAALRGWLESSDSVTVEHATTDGLHRLTFTEGTAQITVPAAPYASRLPWRSLLRIVLGARDDASAYGRPVQLSADDLSRWLKAGERGEAIEFRSVGPVGTLVTAGPDFLGLQVPHTWDGPLPSEGWSPSLRTAGSSSRDASLRWGPGTRTSRARCGRCPHAPVRARNPIWSPPTPWSCRSPRYSRSESS